MVTSVPPTNTVKVPVASVRVPPVPRKVVFTECASFVKKPVTASEPSCTP